MTRITHAVLLLILATLLALGCDDKAEVWQSIPQPSNLERVEEPRLLKAVKNSQDMIVKKPRSAQAWGRLGNIYLIHDWNAEAAACYRRAIALKPKNSGGTITSEEAWLLPIPQRQRTPLPTPLR